MIMKGLYTDLFYFNFLNFIIHIRIKTWYYPYPRTHKTESKNVKKIFFSFSSQTSFGWSGISGRINYKKFLIKNKNFKIYFNLLKSSIFVNNCQINNTTRTCITTFSKKNGICNQLKNYFFLKYFILYLERNRMSFHGYFFNRLLCSENKKRKFFQKWLPQKHPS